MQNVELNILCELQNDNLLIAQNTDVKLNTQTKVEYVYSERTKISQHYTLMKHDRKIVSIRKLEINN